MKCSTIVILWPFMLRVHVAMPDLCLIAQNPNWLLKWGTNMSTRAQKNACQKLYMFMSMYFDLGHKTYRILALTYES
jgi:hypothetical protein